MILLAHGEFASCFKSSSLERPSWTVFFWLSVLIESGLSLLESMIWPNIRCCGESNLIVGDLNRTPGHVLLANFNVDSNCENAQAPDWYFVSQLHFFLAVRDNFEGPSLTFRVLMGGFHFGASLGT